VRERRNVHITNPSGDLKIFSVLKDRTLLTALSFDDGYLNHILIARSLAKIGIKATFYCITHLKTFEGKPLLTMRPEYIQEISDLGHEVGSHTCTHKDLTQLSKDKLKHELRASRLLLEDITGKEITGIAYPYGYFNAKVLSAASENYCYARSAGVYPIEDVYNIKPNKYMISTMTTNRYLQFRYLPTLPMRFLKGDIMHPVMLFHDTHVAKVFTLIRGLKLLNAYFVTVKDFVRSIGV
jgi:peptidoglycan/xylan/chitin deacetylase (PgdA/CDA1 family)